MGALKRIEAMGEDEPLPFWYRGNGGNYTKRYLREGSLLFKATFTMGYIIKMLIPTIFISLLFWQIVINFKSLTTNAVLLDWLIALWPVLAIVPAAYIVYKMAPFSLYLIRNLRSHSSK